MSKFERSITMWQFLATVVGGLVTASVAYGVMVTTSDARHSRSEERLDRVEQEIKDQRQWREKVVDSLGRIEAKLEK